MKRTFLVSSVLVLTAAAFLAPSAPAQAKGFLKISGIAGDSKDADHKGWIDLVSCSWPARAPASGSGPGSVTIVVRAGKAGPGLETKSASGAKFPDVTLEVAGTDRDGKPVTFVYRMIDVTIASYEPSGGSQGQESMTLNFKKVSWTYTPQK